MKINSIKLYNFGSYEGETTFYTEVHDDRNIVLIGGKNGAGKTTLFTAIRICLYGYMSMGYKNAGAYYTHAISKLINNTAKLIKPTYASVTMDISISNGRELDNYILTRYWELNNSINEVFSILKNSEPLNADDVADFEKYLLNLIPPELFNLYFFDGEKIADFFLNEGSNNRIKEAFLTLCGYDTFDIMSKNFKRISSGSINSSGALTEYLSTKELLKNKKAEFVKIEQQLEEGQSAIHNCEADIDSLERGYFQNGGITQDEWDKKLTEIKHEEKCREDLNSWLKKMANDMIPFIIIRDRIAGVRHQLVIEDNNRKYNNFQEIINLPEIKVLLTQQQNDKEINAFSEIEAYAYQKYGSPQASVLDLSIEQSATVLSSIKKILDFDPEEIAKTKKTIKRSINRSARIRQDLDRCNLDSVKTYMEERAKLFEQKSQFLNSQMELEAQFRTQEASVQEAEAALSKAQKILENELKKASINDLAAKSILMLEKLQNNLYHTQIQKVEEFFRFEINVLMSKTHFIDDIRIDDDFNIHIYRNDRISVRKIISVLKENSPEQTVDLFGLEAMRKLYLDASSESLEQVIAFLSGHPDIDMELPIEIDKNTLSNGEKQIFIMSLYHSLMQLYNHEIPFIIDTPFARIDTEHRQNIAEHFFCELKGQVFILSTNEEINSSHIQIMKDKILATYMLENTDNKRTTVVQDTFFEVYYGI